PARRGWPGRDQQDGPRWLLQSPDEPPRIERPRRVQVLLERPHHRETAPDLAPRIDAVRILLGGSRRRFQDQAAAFSPYELPQPRHQRTQSPESVGVPR